MAKNQIKIRTYNLPTIGGGTFLQGLSVPRSQRDTNFMNLCSCGWGVLFNWRNAGHGVWIGNNTDEGKDEMR